MLEKRQYFGDCYDFIHSNSLNVVLGLLYTLGWLEK